LDAQVQRLTEYSNKKGLQLIKSFVLIESSTLGDRRKFKEVISFAKRQNEPIAIIADAVDRVQRSFKESVLLDELVKKGKIELHFYREGIIISQGATATNIMMWNFAVMAAQSYVLQLSENVKRSVGHKIRNGEWPGKGPIGYMNVRTAENKSNIILDPERAPILKKLFQEYSKGGISCKELAKLGYQWGLRSNTPVRNKISPGVLYDILCNPFYSGEMLIKGTRYRHKYESLISPELWEKCNNVRLGFKKAPFKHSEKPYLYRGLILCANSRRIVTTELKKGKHLYLTAYTKEGSRGYVKEEIVTSQVQKVLNSLIIPEEIINEIGTYLKETKKAEVEFHEKTIKDLRRELDLTNYRIQSLIDLYLDRKVGDDIYQTKMESLKKEKLKIDNTIRTHDAGDDNFNETIIGLFEAASKSHIIFAKSSDLDQKRRLLKTVFRTLELKGETLGYSLHFPFDKMQEIAQNKKWRHVVDNIRTIHRGQIKILIEQDVLSFMDRIAA